MPELIKMKTGTISDLESQTGGQPNVSLDKGTIYFAVDTTEHVGKIVYDAPKGTSGVDRIVMSTQAEYADLAGGLAAGTPDKILLDSIEMNANNYSHPTTTAVTPAAVKVGNDANGHVVIGSALTASDVGAKAVQSTVSSPTASGTGISYIETITQDAQGVISATKSTVRDASDAQSGVVSTSAQTFAGNKTFKGHVYPQADSTYDIGSTSLHWRHGYYDDLYVSTDTGYTANNSAKVGSFIGVGNIHLTNTTPTITFHRATAAAATGNIISDTAAGIHITGTVGTENTIYSSRSIKPLVKMDGIVYSTSNIESAGYFLNNTTGGNNTGYFTYGNNVQYGRMYIETIGKAGSVTTTYTNPEDETQTVDGYTGNTTGVMTLILGNDKAVGTNGTSYSSPGTAGTANNARGRIRLYSTNNKYIDILAQTNGNRTVYLPNFGGDMYLIHASNNNAVGGTDTPVYIAANGRATALTGTIKNNTSGSAAKLTTAREIYVALGSTRNANSKVTFDGSADKAIHVSGTLPVARGGTGLTTATNKNAVVIGNSTTVTDAMQTVRTASGAFYATAQDGKPQFGTLPVAQGGTGATSLVNITVGRATADASGNTITSKYVTVDTDQTISGTKTFSAEVKMTASGTSDICSGVLASFKTNRAQITEFITKNIYTGGTNSSTPITFYKYGAVSSQAPATLTQLAQIDTSGNIYEGTTKLSDKYLKLAGGTLTGALTLSSDPTENLHAATKQYVDQSFAANDAMIFKGTIGTGGTVTALPNTHNAGWTYKVITAGTYAGITCEIGDLIICITDGTAANNAHWTVAQTNIDGAVTGPTSATDGNIPLFDGTTGKLIKNSTYSPSSFSASDHVHGNITNAGELSIASRAVVTDANKKITVADMTVASPTAATTTSTTFIDTVSQASNGKISATKKTLPTASTSTAGIIKIGTTANDAAAGNHTHTTLLASDTGTSTVTLTSGGKFKLTAGGTSVIFTMPTSNNYSHPTGDGNSHIPATSTTSNGKFLVAGSTANSAAWKTVKYDKATSLTQSQNVTLKNATAATVTSAGTWPTLGTAFTIPNISSKQVVVSATATQISGSTDDYKITLTTGDSVTTGTAFTVPNVTSIGTAPTFGTTTVAVDKQPTFTINHTSTALTISS